VVTRRPRVAHVTSRCARSVTPPGSGQAMVSLLPNGQNAANNTLLFTFEGLTRACAL
jgi:hypothetical protein